jgi:hypothetical protein
VTIQIEMRGRLEPVIIDGDMAAALNEFNMAAAKGKSFAVMEKPDGKSVGIYIPNMLIFDEVEDDGSYIA